MPRFLVPDGTGFEMHYEVIENVLPQNTLFLHGNLASNRWWSSSLEEWRKLGRGQNWTGHAILAEFRGCGKSSAPKSLDEVDMKRFAKDFLSLLSALGETKINIVGHSTGGLIAALMMSMEPQIFDRAVLLDPVGAQGVKFDHTLLAAFEQMKRDRDLVALVIGSTIRGNDPESAFFRDCIVEDAVHATKSVGPWVLQAVDGLDVRNELSKVVTPTLVLHGEHDTLLPKEHSQDLARLMKAGQFSELANCGHCANVERPASFVTEAHQFLFQ